MGKEDSCVPTCPAARNLASPLCRGPSAAAAGGLGPRSSRGLMAGLSLSSFGGRLFLPPKPGGPLSSLGAGHGAAVKVKFYSVAFVSVR